MPATAYAAPINALIEAMLNDDLARAHYLLDAAPEGEHSLERFEPRTFTLLAKAGYHIKTEEPKDVPSAINLFMSVAYSWYEKHEHSEAHANLFLRMLDALYSISPVLYFDHLLTVGELIRKKIEAFDTEKKDCYHATVKIRATAFEILAEGLQERIRRKKYPIQDLKAFTHYNQHTPLTLARLPGGKHFFETAGKPGACVTADEARIIYRARERHHSTSQEKRVATETPLFPFFELDQTEKATLFSAVLQCDTFNREDARHELNTSRLEFFYHLMTDKNEDAYVNLMIPRSVLVNHYAYSASTMPLYLISINNDRQAAKAPRSSSAQANHLAYRFKMLNQSLKNDKVPASEINAIITALCTTYTKGHDLESNGHKTTGLYPTWFISTTLRVFRIDVNRPLADNEPALIVAWFMEKSIDTLKHLLSLEDVEPSDKSVTAIIEHLEQEVQQAQKTSLLDRETVFAELRTKVDLLLAKLKEDKREAFNAAMVRIGLPSMAVIVRTLELPKQPPEEIVSQILRCTKADLLNTKGYLIKNNIHDFFNMTPTPEQLSDLKKLLLSYSRANMLDKKRFGAFKKTIIEFILADEGRKEKIKAILNVGPEKLEEAIKKNYLLYILSLGRTFLKPHTTQKHFYDKLNHFMALNAVLNGKSLPDKALVKFGLFQAQPADELARDTKKKTDRKKKTRRPRKGPE